MTLPDTQDAALLARCRRLIHDHKTRARLDGVELDYGLAEIRQLLASSPCCRWCKLPLAFDVSLDHVQPIGRGGRHALFNLAAVCRRCQSLKGLLDGGEMEFLLEFLGGLHPTARQDLERRLLAGASRYSKKGE
jgi:5-methylcytosine-specific restriction endonuclease McrA